MLRNKPDTCVGFYIHSIVAIAAFILWAASQLYVVVAIHCIFRRERAVRPLHTASPVTVLKPLCQAEHNLRENLLSFCLQDYPTYQIIFGVQDAGDPALNEVRNLIREHPELDISVVIDGSVSGSNLKVSNLVNMYRSAKHDLIVIADSDMRVGSDYLAAVVAEFHDPTVGAVTCLYSGTAKSGLASRLGAMFINEWFVPSVLVATSFSDLRFCFGATMAVRREALAAIGGLEALNHQLADDHMMGKLVADLGYKVRLCPYIVENLVDEPSLEALFRHELRWARTVRTVQPIGYAMSFVTYAIPMSILVSIGIEASLDWDAMSLLVIWIALSLRVIVHFAVGWTLKSYRPTDLFLIPIRDVLSFAVWMASYAGSNVAWKNQKFYVHADGRMDTRGSVT